GIATSLVGSFAVPFHGFGVVLRHAFAVAVSITETKLGLDMSLISRLAIPLHGFEVVLWNSRTDHTDLIVKGEPTLGLDVSLVSRLAGPLRGFGVVLRHAFAEGIRI